jgi:hypothetical protein
MFDQSVLPTLTQRAATLTFLDRFGLNERGDEKTDGNFASVVLASFARGCVHLLDEDLENRRRAQAEAESTYAIILAHPYPETLNLDPALIAAHFSLLATASIRSVSMEKVVLNMAHVLSSQPKELLMQARMRSAVAMIRRAGIDAPLAAPPYSIVRYLKNPSILFTMTGAEIQEMIEHAAADEIEIVPELAEVLSLIALSELRNYRVDFGAKILRLLFSQGLSNIYAEEALRFVALQRRRDGGYGFLDPLNEDIEMHNNPLFSFHLPVTLNAVWLFKKYAGASAEAEPAERVIL